MESWFAKQWTGGIAVMKIGLAETAITPPLGLQIPGYGPKKRLSSGMKDELYAKAMVMEADGTILAFIVLDIISLDLEPAQRIRRRVNEYTGIPESQIMISCTHTHTGPPRPSGEAEKAYYPYLEAKAADAAIIAYGRRQEAKLGFGRGYEDSIAFNRRYYMKDGTVKTNPGILNPDIDRPEGPIDPEVIVMRIDNEQGEPIGIVSNYACHTDTVGGTEYSGDYPAYVSQTVKKLYGEHVVSLFFQGACGNINHHDVKGRIDPKILPHPIRMGQILGLEVARVRNRIKAVPDARKLASASRIVTVSERRPSEKELEWARNHLEKLKQIPEDQWTSGQMLEKDRAELFLRSVEQPLSANDYEIQVCAVGELAIVALPAEIFVEFGLEIKEKSPFEYTVINELANGSGNGYVCTPLAHANGSYEPSGLRFAPEAGGQFVRAALELLQELYQQQS
jgi:hypothetical protein